MCVGGGGRGGDSFCMRHGSFMNICRLTTFKVARKTKEKEVTVLSITINILNCKRIWHVGKLPVTWG